MQFNKRQATCGFAWALTCTFGLADYKTSQHQKAPASGVICYVGFVLTSIELNAFQTIIDSFLKALSQFIAGESGIDFGSIEGFLNAQIFTIMAPIFAISVAVNSGGKSTALEETNQSLDIILSTPITRDKFLIQKVSSMIIKTLFISSVHWISYYLLCKLFSENISAEGCDLYSTMEPCSKRLSGNEPCAKRIIEYNLKRVSVGVLEPANFVNCTGVQQLLDAGIEVIAVQAEGLKEKCLAPNKHVLQK